MSFFFFFFVSATSIWLLFAFFLSPLFARITITHS